jgi:hypothetical protein
VAVAVVQLVLLRVLVVAVVPVDTEPRYLEQHLVVVVRLN